jgi:hypothetical protein
MFHGKNVLTQYGAKLVVGNVGKFLLDPLTGGGWESRGFDTGSILYI